jgi:ankyrin repeat protein
VLAIGRGDLAQVESLVKTTPALAVQPDPNGRTPLHLAMTSKCEIAGYLVAQKADVNKGDFENWRPIHVAAEAGRADMVKLLLENEADPNSTATQTAQTPLYIAAVYGFTEVARNLLAAHANPNLNNSRGVSPLHRAAESGYIDIVSLLILAKAEINAKDQVGKTPLDYAITANRPEIIGLLVKYGATGSLPVPAVLPPAATPAVPGAIGARKADPNAKLDPVQEKAFIDACANCDGAKMDELLKADLNLAYSKTPPDNGAYNGLHLIPCSTVKGTPALAAKILDLGVPVDIRNGWQRTPLCRAAEMGNPQMVGYYLDKGADVNAVDGSGWTPLYAVSQAGDAETYVKCVNFLLDHKADATIKDKLKNETAYAAAKRSGNLQVVAAFEARGMKE